MDLRILNSHRLYDISDAAVFESIVIQRRSRPSDRQRGRLEHNLSFRVLQLQVGEGKIIVRIQIHHGPRQGAIDALPCRVFDDRFQILCDDRTDQQINDTEHDENKCCDTIDPPFDSASQGQVLQSKKKFQGSGLAPGACRPLLGDERVETGSISSKGSKGVGAAHKKSEAPRSINRAMPEGQRLTGFPFMVS